MFILRKTASRFISIFALVVLTSCGGGGSGATSGPNDSSSASARFLYTANGASISQYRIDNSSGQLQFVQDYPASNPRALATVANGKYLYTTNPTDGGVSAFRISPVDGLLSPIDADSVAPGIQNYSNGNTPYSITADPTGRYIYIGNHNPNLLTQESISAFRVNAMSGELTRIDLSPNDPGTYDMAGTSPYNLSIDSTGNYLSIANYSGGRIDLYRIDQTTGTITFATSASIQRGSFAAAPASISFVSNTNWLYVANNLGSVAAFGFAGSSTMLQLNPIDADPSTTPIDDYRASTHPQGSTVDPSGRFLYVANFSTRSISAYAIDRSYGTLSYIDADSSTNEIENFDAGDSPTLLVADPTGRFLYVRNDGFYTNTPSISILRIDATSGKLIANGTINTRSTGVGIVLVN